MFSAVFEGCDISKSLCSCPSGCSTESQNSACLFLNALSPQIEQMMSERILPSWYGSKLIHQLGGAPNSIFYKCDPQTSSYELQTSLTSLFLKLQIVEGRNQMCFLQSTFLWPRIGLQTISLYNVFCSLQWSSNEYQGEVFC